MLRRNLGLLLMVACGGHPEVLETEIWMPEGADGKADTVTTLSGAQIPSRFVDAGKTYLTSRSIDALTDVGALDEVAASVASRVDGVIANLPADGNLQVAELVRMEDPSFYATLFPEEQQAFEHLWTLLEGPDAQVTTIDFPTLSPFETVEMTVAPSILDMPAHLDISSLPADLQIPARRLELVLNLDGQGTTVHLTDLDMALAAPFRFTEADVAAFKAMTKIFHERATTRADARVQVPEPGATNHDRSIGELTISQRTSVRYEEWRTFTWNTISRSNHWLVNLSGTRSLEVTALLPAGVSAVLIRESDGEETVIQGAPFAIELQGGTFILEFWRANTRLRPGTRVVLPTLAPRAESLELWPYFDYDFYTPQGTKLVKNLISGGNYATGQGSESRAHSTYDLSAQAPSEPYASVPSEVQTPRFPLAGRYEIRSTSLSFPVWIDVYPQGVLKATLNGTEFRLRPNVSYNGLRAQKELSGWVRGEGQVRVIEDGTIYLYDGSTFVGEFRLTPDLRIG